MVIFAVLYGQMQMKNALFYRENDGKMKGVYHE